MSDTDFWLNPAGLREQAGAFTQYAGQAASAKAWLQGLTITDSSSYDAYTRVAGSAIEIRASLIDWFDHLEQVLDGAATELIAVADEGEGIDREQAALIDATDPDVYNGNEQSPDGGSGEIAPTYDRTEDSLPVWGPPTGGAAYFCDLGMHDELNQLTTDLVPGDLLSPSEWVDTVLGWLGAQTLPERVLQEYGGRWGDIRRFADTIAGLASLVDDMRGHLSSAVAYAGVQWQGYASNSAQAYFEDLLNALSDAQLALADAGVVFSDYCTGVIQSADEIAGAIYGLYDAVLIAAAGAAFGTGTAWTGGGAVAGYGTAGVSLLWAFKKLSDVNDILQNLSSLYSILEALGNLSGDLSNFAATLPVPAMEQTS
ncbi:hypothetical protein [Microbacterium sp. 18062]|uniref:hypothetical protein n=1 Tax=Microbacterium sp. 18062 TaxID=2681410 RepID=UPI00135B8255|nr:hypothetical protein [Microbacterium sp. 18062]